MTALVLILLVAQAAALFWTSVHVSNVVLRSQPVGPVLFAVAGMAVAIAVGRYGADDDPHRALCTTGDCIVLVLGVGFIRVVLMNKEAEQLAQEARIEAIAAAEAAAVARKAEAEAYVQAAAAALEARKNQPVAKSSAPRPRSGPSPGPRPTKP